MTRDTESFGPFALKSSAGGTVRLATVALLLSAFSVSPALASGAARAKVATVTTETQGAGFRLKSQSLPSFVPMTIDVSRFAFTAPGRVANSRVQTVERGFQFTPSGGSVGRDVSLSIATRSLSTPARTAMASAADTAAGDANILPTGQSIDLALGFRGFSVSGGVSRVDTGIGGGRRDGADIGLSYAGRNWTTGIQASVETDAPRLLSPGPAADRYGVEAAGALALSPAISVGGSFRYRMAPPNPTPLDPNKDDRAVFLGGAVAF